MKAPPTRKVNNSLRFIIILLLFLEINRYWIYVAPRFCAAVVDRSPKQVGKGMGWSVVSFVLRISFTHSFRFGSFLLPPGAFIICAIFCFCFRARSVCLSSFVVLRTPPRKTTTKQNCNQPKKRGNALVCRTDLPYNVHVRSTEYLVEVRMYRYNTALAALIIHHSHIIP